MGLFDDLEKIGLTGLEDMEIFSNPQEQHEQNRVTAQAKTTQVSEEESLFEKTYNCVVCDKTFKALTVRTGKVRMVSREKDLRPVYNTFDALKYDVVSCPYCGFTSLARYFSPLAAPQKKLVLEKITSKVKPFDAHKSKLSYEEAIDMYKLALVNSVVKMSKLSERAYTCLKIGWLFRGYASEIAKTSEGDELIEKLSWQEDEYLKKAYEGFKMAIMQETFPMCGMDEHTISYIIAVLALRFGESDISKKMVADILINKNASAAIKDKARDLKEELIAGA